MTITFSLYMALEVTLALRGMLQINLRVAKTNKLILCLHLVYVLYKHQRIVVTLMAMSLLCGTGFNISCAVKVFRQLEFDNHCYGYGMPKEYVYLKCAINLQL
jgi:hypothetical protein